MLDSHRLKVCWQVVWVDPHATEAGMVDSLKYLNPDNKLSSDQHINNIQQRINQRQPDISKFKGLNVVSQLLHLSEDLLNLSRSAAKTIHLPAPGLSEINSKAMKGKAITVTQGISHPFNSHFTLVYSGCRYMTLRGRGAHFGKSLVPVAITALNRVTH